jgi:DNA-binding Lrp family transcriptional regulator
MSDKTPVSDLHLKEKAKGLWIPLPILEHKDLTLSQATLLAKINNFEECFASNRYLADFAKVTPSAISQQIAKLEKMGFVNTELIKKGKLVVKRIITVNEAMFYGIKNSNQGIKNSNQGIKNSNQGYLENCEDNNKDIEIQINNTDSKLPKKQSAIEKIKSDYEILSLVDEQVLSDWLELRKQHKAVNSKTALTRIENTLNELFHIHRIDPNEALAIQIERGWRGLKSDWVINHLSANQQKSNLHTAQVTRTSHVNNGWFEELQEDMANGEII